MKRESKEADVGGREGKGAVRSAVAPAMACATTAAAASRSCAGLPAARRASEAAPTQRDTRCCWKAGGREGVERRGGRCTAATVAGRRWVARQITADAALWGAG